MRRPGRHLVSVAAAFLAPRVLLGDQQTSEAVREFSPRATQNDRKLAVVVPVHEGDVSRALSSLEMWPDVCSPVTLANMDLVIYKAETAGESSAKILATAEETAGRCFARTKILHANLPPEDNVYPKGPSVQFYKLFLDEEVRQHFVTYDALMILEWDVLVAHDSSFEQLYHATFDATEPFWVKGSVLEGTSFHGIAQMKDMWHVMGHINGNAIYNNTDPYFMEYVEYSKVRWGYDYPYDVALWATISNFPYSWPLWQRYASKFVATDLIANVGLNNVDAQALSNAVAGDTLFIHGKSVEGGSRDIRDDADIDIEEAIEPDVSCEATCGTEHEESSGMSTVCDPSCETDNRFAGYLCGAGDPLRFGSSCRTCYTDQEAALVAEGELRLEDPFTSEARHVIMCDTRRPPEAMECSAKCTLKTDTVCDPTCGTGRYGDYNCNWRDRGLSCRYCFDDVEAALIADEVARRRGGRVIMCDTHEPPSAGGVEEEEEDEEEEEEEELGENELDEEGLGRVGGIRGEVLEVMANKEDGEHESEAASVSSNALPRFDERMRSDPKWRRRMKKSRLRRHSRRLQTCTEGCEVERTDTGRVCDPTCSNPTSDSYGTRGCGTGSFGYDCRFCYINEDMALEVDRPGYHVIMCDTLMPPVAYTRRSLVGRDSNPLSFHPAGKDELDAAGMDKPDAAVNPRHKDQGWKDAFLANGDEPKWKRTMKSGRKRTLQSMDSSMSCTDECEADGDYEGRVCDPTCSNPTSDSYGTRGCAVGNYGQDCRHCYYDEEMALEADRPNYHVIMCDTMAPPLAYTRRLFRTSRAEVYAVDPAETREDEELALGTVETPKGEELDRDMAFRKRNVKSPTPRGLQTSDSSMSCTDECEADGDSEGRVCDPTCSNPTSDSYGTRGCAVGNYGQDCRHCYYDEEMALEADRPNYHVIMCDTMAPPLAYTARRLAEGEGEEDEEYRDGDDAKHVVSLEEYESMASVPFGYDLREGQLCAFMGATSESLSETEVTVRSVRKFMPGIRLAIAVSEEDYGIFQRAFYKMPGLSISTTKNVRVSALLADKYCGDDAELIYYLQPGTLVSRPFSNKDTHSPRGKLLVVFTDGRGADFATLASAQAASALLGFRVPIFTYGTDLILPSNANMDFRRLLSIVVPPESDGHHGYPVSINTQMDFLDEERISVPEVLAAHLYARNPEGVWFLNPQEWVAQHLFKTASIWDIPLVKPRFSCSLDPHLDVEEYDFREDLSRQLEVFSYGGTCDSGVMNIRAPATRLSKPSSRRRA